MESQAPRMPDASVFLSYHPGDEAWAERVGGALESVCRVELRPLGREESEHRLLRLERASVVVLLVSEAYLGADEFLGRELPLLESISREQSLRVLAFHLESCSEAARQILKGLPVRSIVGLSPEAPGIEAQRLLGVLARCVAESLESSVEDPTKDFEEPDIDLVFDQLYLEHYGALVAFFGHRGLDAETSRDLAQTTMLQVYKGLSGFQSRASSRSWVKRIATHVWCNWVRDHRATLKRKGREASLEHAREQGFEVAEEDGFWTSQASDPERLALRRDAQDRIQARISGLSSRQQSCLTRWLEGWSYQEIAEDLGVSIQTVRASLHKAKAHVTEDVRQEFQRPARGASLAGAAP